MIDFDKLIPFIKKALENSPSVTPEEVYAVLQENQSNGTTEDQDLETLDGDILDRSSQTQEEIKNEEGKLMEGAFPELEVEDAIETVKERKEFESPEKLAETTNSSVWDKLVDLYGNNRR